MKLKEITTIILACTLLITGCSTGEAEQNKDKSNVEQSATVTYPLTIKHTYGETVIDKQPEKVVTIS